MDLTTIFAVLTALSFVPVIFDFVNAWRPNLASRLPIKQTGTMLFITTTTMITSALYLYITAWLPYYLQMKPTVFSLSVHFIVASFLGVNTLTNLMAAHFTLPGYLPLQSSSSPSADQPKEAKHSSPNKSKQNESDKTGEVKLNENIRQRVTDSKEEMKVSSEHKPHYYLDKHFCRFCNIDAPERSYHCFTCNRCILEFDHHCPFVANCIGRENHKWFTLFLFYTFLGTVYSMVCTARPFIDCYLNYKVMHNHPGCLIFGPHSLIFVAFFWALVLDMFFLSWQFYVVFTKIPTVRIIKEFRGNSFDKFRSLLIGGLQNGSWSNISEFFGSDFLIMVVAPLFALLRQYFRLVE